MIVDKIIRMSNGVVRLQGHSTVRIELSPTTVEQVEAVKRYIGIDGASDDDLIETLKASRLGITKTIAAREDKRLLCVVSEE